MRGDITLDTMASTQLCVAPLSKAINNLSYKPVPAVNGDYPERLMRYPLTGKRQGIHRQGQGSGKRTSCKLHLVLLPTYSHHLSALPNPLNLSDTVENCLSINGKEDPAHPKLVQ